MIDFDKIPSPCFVLDESLLRHNLEQIADVEKRAGIEIILALKACAMWSVFPIIKEYVGGATASSLSEARLVYEEFGTLAHTYAPVYADRDFSDIMRYSNHITFNSLAQYHRFAPQALIRGISCGLRINPEHSSVGTELYNPCSEGSRLGVTAGQLDETESAADTGTKEFAGMGGAVEDGGLPDGLEGFHFHTLCESSPEDLASTLEAVEAKFGRWLPSLKWLNMGGGHLMTRKGYDRDKLVDILLGFKKRYPNLRVILEPGSAFTWQTGYLVSRIEDIVSRGGVDTLMVDVSFACHMPDCLEMPYKPAITGAHDPAPGDKRWRVGGNCCLAGDWVGDWAFDREPKVGDRLVFEDMIHYTMVKTTMFNGVAHPAIAYVDTEGQLHMVREFGYDDYRDRMS